MIIWDQLIKRWITLLLDPYNKPEDCFCILQTWLYEISINHRFWSEETSEIWLS